MNTFYTVNNTSLLLLSPFMPFITEELWQRLPRRPKDETPSIIITKFPVYDEKLNDPEADSAYKVILDTSKAIRSLNAEYRIFDTKGILHSTTSQLKIILSSIRQGFQRNNF